MFLYLENRKRLEELRNTGRVFSINIGSEKGRTKDMVRRGYLEAGFGLEGDAHAGSIKRQVSLLSIEEIEKFEASGPASGIDLRPGIFAENITTEGLDLSGLKVGDRLYIGEEAVLVVTQVGKTCHNPCHIASTIGQCIMPRQGIFASVEKSGVICVRDSIRLAARRPALFSRNISIKDSIRSFLLGTK